MRQIVLDTETTGLDPKHGHRVIEVGCVEIENRKLTGRHFHRYLNPERDIDEGAQEVHGLTRAFLSNKPLFRHIEKELIEFVRGAELVIHNAPFDIGFLDSELALANSNHKGMTSLCGVLDTLLLARKKHPGQRNSLDALCKRYDINNSQRQLHGALLDAEILADVYLVMTSGQSSLLLKEDADEVTETQHRIRKFNPQRKQLLVLRANAQEKAAHKKRLTDIAKTSNDFCVWTQMDMEN
ncbi:MAG TPA: DNA polymerase III subunit epsilon [Gammaproteobacteria bacterium]|nr:DNA polymerase III subunit epsilon [Gammaproteobacteria bacterium]|tara:strand:+ start:924 stop:1643 length:720 start_codon:yes stop_codon:yes gene_type:complete